jgi:hypothetical protein
MGDPVKGAPMPFAWHAAATIGPDFLLGERALDIVS